MEKCKIVAVEKFDFNPVLVNFQNGMDSCESMDVVLAASSGKSKSNKKQHMLIASTEDTVYGGEIVKSSATDNYLAIRNKSTNKIRLVPIDFCSMISEHYYSATRITPQAGNKKQMQLLLAKYGGKKAIRAHDKIHRMQVNVDIIKTQLDQSMAITKETIKIEKLEEEALMANDEEVEPPKNYDAKKLNEIYDIETILTKELVHELEEVAQEVLQTKPEDLPLTAAFLVSKFRLIQLCPKLHQEEKLLKIKAIIFLDALINLLQRVKLRQHLASRPLSDICENVEIFIRRRFTNSKSIKPIFTQYTKKKAVCHVLVLSILLSDKLEVCMEDMILNLKLEKQAILDFARYLNLRTALNGYMLGLKLPSTKEEEDSKKVRRFATEKQKKR